MFTRIWNAIFTRLDTSDYLEQTVQYAFREQKNTRPDEGRKNNGVIMTEFVGLRVKMWWRQKGQKAKGVKNKVIGR